MLGLDPSDPPLVLYLLTATWNNAADDNLAQTTAKQVIDDVETTAEQKGLYSAYKYLNYADGTQNVIDGYGSANKAKLEAASKKYDPNGVFQKQVTGGFKVFAAGSNATT